MVLKFISKELESWADEQQLVQAFIPPGQPRHNGFVESMHNRMRDELFEDNLFYGINDAEERIAWWRYRYNNEHPHSALGYMTPNAFAEKWKHENQMATA
ncbi:integrase core domain-containing protein [Corynebacterium phocae]|uniref:integrase core domain-containing protein n=2 Tax=Corynebacterium phocae TaxID=161895 RepID=UPI0012EED7E5|nr:integrase core domain-containing protein [Corynebacterium phocae]